MPTSQGNSQIIVNPTKVREQMCHPVFIALQSVFPADSRVLLSAAAAPTALSPTPASSPSAAYVPANVVGGVAGPAAGTASNPADAAGHAHPLSPHVRRVTYGLQVCRYVLETLCHALCHALSILLKGHKVDCRVPRRQRRTRQEVNFVQLPLFEKIKCHLLKSRTADHTAIIRLMKSSAEHSDFRCNRLQAT